MISCLQSWSGFCSVVGVKGGGEVELDVCCVVQQRVGGKGKEDGEAELNVLCGAAKAASVVELIDNKRKTHKE